MGKLLGILQRVVEAPRVDTRISLPYGGRNLCILVNKKKKTEDRGEGRIRSSGGRDLFPGSASSVTGWKSIRDREKRVTPTRSFVRSFCVS